MGPCLVQRAINVRCEKVARVTPVLEEGETEDPLDLENGQYDASESLCLPSRVDENDVLNMHAFEKCPSTPSCNFFLNLEDVPHHQYQRQRWGLDAYDCCIVQLVR